MTEPTKTRPDRSRATEPDPPQPERPASRPWRAEGLPPGNTGDAPTPPRRDWWRFALRGLVIYAIVFGLLTLQDRLDGPQTITYSEFSQQVAETALPGVLKLLVVQALLSKQRSLTL